MKRFWGALCAFLMVCAALFTLHASAESAASKIDLYCTVNSDGDCLVSMTVNLRIEAADDGLTFPLPYNANDITMNGSSVASSRVSNRTLVAVGRVTGGMTGEFPVRFDFTLPKAVGVTADKQLQLTIPMLCGFDYPVESLSFIITLPDTVESKPVFTSTYQQNGFESNLELAVNGNMITGSSINTLNDHEAVTMTMTVSKDMFPSVSTYQRTGNPEIVPMGIIAGLALLYWLLFLRTLPPQHQRTTVPPEGISAGELGCRVTMTGGDLTMMVLSWAQMGYLLIQPDGHRVLLHKRMDMGNERSLFEVRVFQSLFGNRRVVDCSSLAYAKLCKKTASMVPGEKTMCRPRSGSRKIFRWLLCISQVFCGICVAMNMTSIPVLQIMFSLIFGLLSAVSAWEIHEFAMHIMSRFKARAWIALVICLFWVLLGLAAGQPWVPLVSVTVQLLLGFLAAYGGMRTERNRSEAGEILSIRRFMRRIPRPEAARLLKADPEYFYRMAPYAIALGVGKPFAAAFGRRKLEQCPYLFTKNQSSRTAEEWMRLMLQTVALMDDRYLRMQTEKWMAIRFR
ncbi:MAG: DUF2207 family protein [Faecousia sp.]